MQKKSKKSTRPLFDGTPEVLTVSREYVGRSLADFLRENGAAVASPCGGRGSCGKCTVTLSTGEVVLACQTVCREGMQVLLPRTAVPAGENDFSYSDGASNPEKEGRNGAARVGLALDIGTTTLAFSFVNLDTGAVLSEKSCLNPQSAFGADVITRIRQCPAHLSEMQACLLDAVWEKAAEFFPLAVMTVVGNPTMLSIFCGVSPEPMGTFPFTPAFKDALTFDGAHFGVPVGEIRVLAGASAFIGADVLAGVLETGLLEQQKNRLLLDLGTNGEMALYCAKQSKIYAASAAAGPALEGANISCGVGGIRGAVSKVYLENGSFFFETVGDASPIGICGSGLVDLIACLLQTGDLDETGALEGGDFSLTASQVKHGVVSSEPFRVLTLTQKDIREFQLAKSAIRAGVEILLRKADLPEDGLDLVFIAGGMGYYLSGASAVRVGLLPSSFLGRTEAIGNSALKGAVRALLLTEVLRREASVTETVELNGEADFSDLFIEHMIFPEAED